jgi:hypothetical protein
LGHTLSDFEDICITLIEPDIKKQKDLEALRGDSLLEDIG